MKRLAPASRAIVLVVIAATLSGCAGSLLPGAGKEPPRLYVLTPKSTFPDSLPSVDWQLTVTRPVAEAGLNGTRIALRPNPISLEFFARANWVDTAPTMVQTLLVESFENTGKIIAVGRDSVTLRADYNLLTELREFQAEYFGGGPPKIRVRINAKLVRMPQREIFATTTFERIEQASGSDLESVINAFDVALGKTVKRIVIWTLTTPPPARP
jgi:cholesterol transport system auxiliary component